MWPGPSSDERRITSEGPNPPRPGSSLPVEKPQRRAPLSHIRCSGTSTWHSWRAASAIRPRSGRLTPRIWTPPAVDPMKLTLWPNARGKDCQDQGPEVLGQGSHEVRDDGLR